MSKVGRKSLMIPTVEWKCRIPEPLAAKADLLCLDPVTGGLRYGARSELITQLLRAHLDGLGKGKQDAISGDINPSINLPIKGETP